MKREDRSTLADYDETKAVQLAFLTQCRRVAAIGVSAFIQKLRSILFKSRSTCYKYVYGQTPLPWHDAITLSRYFGIKIPSYENKATDDTGD